MICVLLGPYFPGIGFMSKELITSVKEIEGVKVITRKNNIYSLSAEKIGHFFKKAPIIPIQNEQELFNQILFHLYSLTKNKEAIENGFLPTWIAKITNLVCEEKNTGKLEPTVHFQSIKKTWQIKNNLVTYQLQEELNSSFNSFRKNNNFISEVRLSLEGYGLNSYNINLIQQQNKNSAQIIPSYDLKFIDEKLSSIALFDFFNDARKLDDPFFYTQALLSDGDNKNPLNVEGNKVLRLQFTDACFISEQINSPVQPFLVPGQEDYKIIYDQKEQAIEIKTSLKDKPYTSFAADKLKRFKLNFAKINSPVILSLNFPFNKELITEQEIQELKNMKKKFPHISLIVITQCTNDNKIN